MNFVCVILHFIFCIALAFGQIQDQGQQPPQSNLLSIEPNVNVSPIARPVSNVTVVKGNGGQFGGPRGQGADPPRDPTSATPTSTPTPTPTPTATPTPKATTQSSQQQPVQSVQVPLSPNLQALSQQSLSQPPSQPPLNPLPQLPPRRVVDPPAPNSARQTGSGSPSPSSPGQPRIPADDGSSREQNQEIGKPGSRESGKQNPKSPPVDPPAPGIQPQEKPPQQFQNGIVQFPPQKEIVSASNKLEVAPAQPSDRIPPPPQPKEEGSRQDPRPNGQPQVDQRKSSPVDGQLAPSPQSNQSPGSRNQPLPGNGQPSQQQKSNEPPLGAQPAAQVPLIPKQQ